MTETDVWTGAQARVAKVWAVTLPPGGHRFVPVSPSPRLPVSPSHRLTVSLSPHCHRHSASRSQTSSLLLAPPPTTSHLGQLPHPLHFPLSFCLLSLSLLLSRSPFFRTREHTVTGLPASLRGCRSGLSGVRSDRPAAPSVGCWTAGRPAAPSPIARRGCAVAVLWLCCACACACAVTVYLAVCLLHRFHPIAPHAPPPPPRADAARLPVPGPTSSKTTTNIPARSLCRHRLSDNLDKSLASLEKWYLVNFSAEVRQLRHHLGPFLAHISVFVIPHAVPVLHSTSCPCWPDAGRMQVRC